MKLKKPFTSVPRKENTFYNRHTTKYIHKTQKRNTRLHND